MLELDAIQTVTLLIGFCRTPKSKNMFNDNTLEMEEWRNVSSEIIWHLLNFQSRVHLPN